MNQKQAHSLGKNTGIGIGHQLLTDSDMTFNDADALVSEGLAVEENARQYSPFEFTAREFNDTKYPDEIWEKYDAGVAAGLRDSWKQWGVKNG